MVKAASLYQLLAEAARQLDPARRLRVWQEGLQAWAEGPVAIRLLPEWLTVFGLGQEAAWQGGLPAEPRRLSAGWRWPLTTPGVALGVLELTGPRVALAAELCALSLGEAAEQAQLTEQLVMAERRRLAADLHDGIAQMLYLMKIELELARRGLAQVGEQQAQQWSERLTSTERLAKLALSELRQQISRLRAGGALAADWLNNLLDLRNRYDQFQGVRVEVEVAPNVAHLIPPAVGETLYRVAQEATHNALKHAGAQTVTIRLVPVAGGIRLEVSDDGCGLKADLTPGYGFQVMGERAAAINATFEVVGGPTGTQVSLFWGEGDDGSHQALAD